MTLMSGIFGGTMVICSGIPRSPTVMGTSPTKSLSKSPIAIGEGEEEGPQTTVTIQDTKGGVPHATLIGGGVPNCIGSKLGTGQKHISAILGAGPNSIGDKLGAKSSIGRKLGGSQKQIGANTGGSQKQIADRLGAASKLIKLGIGSSGP